MSTDQKAIWQRYYKERRDALLSKVEDLSEYEARRPRTPTGTSLIGIIKHVLNVEAVYLGATFERRSLLGNNSVNFLSTLSAALIALLLSL